MSNKLLFIMRHAPYGSNLAREALEAALAASSFQQQVSLLFMDDGIYQLTQDHQPHTIQQKNHSAMLQALPMYDITQIYIEEYSLKQRGLHNLRLPSDSVTIDSKAIAALIGQHDHILSF